MALAVALEGVRQLALPDEAPGSDHVGYDVYLQFSLVHRSLHFEMRES